MSEGRCKTCGSKDIEYLAWDDLHDDYLLYKCKNCGAEHSTVPLEN